MPAKDDPMMSEWPDELQRHILARAEALRSPTPEQPMTALSEPMIPKSMHDGAVDAARQFGRQDMEREAMQTVARIVLAAGGEVRVPNRLALLDVEMWRDPVNGETVYRARERRDDEC